MLNQFFTPAQKKRLISRLILIGLLLAASFLKPRIDQWLGNTPKAPDASANISTSDLPAERPEIIESPSPEQPEITTAQRYEIDQQPDEASVRISASQRQSRSAPVGQSQTDRSTEYASTLPEDGTQPDRTGSLASNNPSTSSVAGDAASKPSSGQKPSEQNPASTSGHQGSRERPEQKSEPKLGQFKEIRNNVFESTAGLVYVPGSADGHRLRHVMKHAKDEPSKPVHGVFDGDGDRDIVFGLIDEAWIAKLKGGKNVRKQNQGDRTVYTVRMDQRVGYVVGSEGKRQKYPECRYIRIVVERENVVISAYPTKSF